MEEFHQPPNTHNLALTVGIITPGQSCFISISSYSPVSRGILSLHIIPLLSISLKKTKILTGKDKCIIISIAVLFKQLRYGGK